MFICLFVCSFIQPWTSCPPARSFNLFSLSFIACFPSCFPDPLRPSLMRPICIMQLWLQYESIISSLDYSMKVLPPPLITVLPTHNADNRSRPVAAKIGKLVCARWRTLHALWFLDVPCHDTLLLWYFGTFGASLFVLSWRPSNLACSHFCAIHSWIYLAMVTLKLSFTTTWQIGTHLGFTYSCWYFWHKLVFTWTFGTFKKTWTLGVFKNTWTSPS